MRIIILKDNKIDKHEAEAAVGQMKALYKEHAGIRSEATIEEREFKGIPYEEYWGGLRGVKQSFLGTLAKDVAFRHGKRAFDHIVVMVHPDNWTPLEDGIWGWNLSIPKSGMETQQVLFDTENPANTLGTLYHETMHAHDQFAERILNKTDIIERTLGVSDWDNEVVHGQGERFEYIRHKENTDALAAIAKPLKQAFAKRAMRHHRAVLAERASNAAKRGGSPAGTLDLLNDAIEWFRGITNRLRRSDQPIFKNNTCVCKSTK